MHIKIKQIGAGVAMAAGVLLPAPAASADTSVDFASLSSTDQALVTEAVSRTGLGTVGGQTVTVPGLDGNPCFEIFVGKVTFNEYGQITSIETATVIFYQPIASCII